MQRLYSEFPGAYPGAGLLLLRVLMCGMIIRLEGTCPNAVVSENHTFAESLPCGLLFAGSVLILTGFLTPVAGFLVALVEGAKAIFEMLNAVNGGQTDWVYSLFIAGAASSLVLTGPGGFSLDARIFGPRRLFIPRNNGQESVRRGTR